MKKIIPIFILVFVFLGYLVINNRLDNTESSKGNNSNQKTGLQEQVIGEGEHFFPDGLKVGEKEILTIEPGACLIMGENSLIEVKGRIVAQGSEEKPIIFKAEEKYWRGIKISRDGKNPEAEKFWEWIKKGDIEREEIFFSKINSGSFFNHCVFKNISTEERVFEMGNKWKGAIEAYSASLQVSNSTFEDVLHIGGVLTRQSYFVINNSQFTSDTLHKSINSIDNSVGIIYKNNIIQKRTKNQRCADGIWINDSTALIYDNVLANIGDDGIDTDGSNVVVLGNKINGAQDDGIDIDSQGQTFIIQNTVSNAKDNGVLISNKSSAILSNNEINSSKYGLTLRDGSTATAGNIKITENQTGILLFADIPCALAKNDFMKVRNKLASFTDEETVSQEINGVTTADELIQLLENNYDQQENYYLYNKESFRKNIQEIFKLVDLLDLEYIESVETKKNPFCAELKNSLYLVNSEIRNNLKDISALHNYQMQIRDTEFNSEKYKRQAQKLTTKNFPSELINEADVAPIISNAKRIMSKLP